MKNKIPTEHVEQREFVSWFRKTFDSRIFAIPNGGKRNKIVANKLKLEGVSPGVPDLFIPSWRLWVEMKVQKGGYLSEKQEEWRDYLLSCGYSYIVGNGCEDAKEKIIEFFNNSC